MKTIIEKHFREQIPNTVFLIFRFRFDFLSIFHFVFDFSIFFLNNFPRFFFFFFFSNFFPKEEREGKELRRLRPQGPGGFVPSLSQVLVRVAKIASLHMASSYLLAQQQK